MQNTTNLKLKKPNLTDAINIDDFNYNADIIDAEIKKLLDSVGSLASLNTAQKTNLVGAINEVLSKFNSIKLEADNVTIADLENLFTATKVEGALSEVMKKAKANETSILEIEKEIRSKHEHDDKLFKSDTDSYFSSSDAEKNLNNIKFNLYCYVYASYNLINLPPNQSGGAGIFECRVTYKNNSVYHVIQRYYVTTSNREWTRSINVDNSNTEWTEWEEVIKGGYSEATLLLLNGFVKCFDEDVPHVFKRGDVATINLSIKNPSTVADQTIVCNLPSEYIPKRYTRVTANTHDTSYSYSIDINTRGEVRIRSTRYSANTELRLNASWLTK